VRPTYEAVRIVKNERLAYYLDSADIDFWNCHWKSHISPEWYAGAERGELDWLEEGFTRYLPKKGRILEAGCGLGQYVLALRVRGYEVEGVDSAKETVETARSLYPNLPIRCGDATCLEVPDGYYGGYISLGVVEHRQNGPEPFIREAYRVLTARGVALIAVPSFHALRRLKAHLGMYGGPIIGLDFYQYAFSEKEFRTLLRDGGFEVIDRINYNGFKGIKDEIPLLRRMLKWRRLGPRFQRWLLSWKWADKRLGHMILFVCKKAS
jgi:SAM-dependent methyltransferase